MAGTKGVHPGRISTVAIQMLSLPSQAGIGCYLSLSGIAGVSQGLGLGLINHKTRMNITKNRNRKKE